MEILKATLVFLIIVNGVLIIQIIIRTISWFMNNLLRYEYTRWIEWILSIDILPLVYILDITFVIIGLIVGVYCLIHWCS